MLAAGFRLKGLGEDHRIGKYVGSAFESLKY
jgi:hypothetical protein